MANIDIIDRVDEIQRDIEKLKFIAFQVQDFFGKNFDNVNLAYCEKKRLIPLAEMLADYALIMDSKISKLQLKLQN